MINRVTEIEEPMKMNYKKESAIGYSIVCKWIFIAIVGFFLPFSSSKAQSTMSYAIHANIIYHFTKYINWPPEKKSGDFVIGIVGDSPLYEQMKKMTVNKTAGGQRIVIKKFSGSEETYECHILFVSEDASARLRKIAARTRDLPVLLVCEEEGAASRGAGINFSLDLNRLTLEINKINIEQRNLQIAGELLKLGKMVK